MSDEKEGVPSHIEPEKTEEGTIVNTSKRFVIAATPASPTAHLMDAKLGRIIRTFGVNDNVAHKEATTLKEILTEFAERLAICEQQLELRPRMKEERR